MPKKLTIEYIKKEFWDRKKYELVSTEYINSKTKLVFVCDKGHRHSMCWNNFQQDVECPTCSRDSLIGLTNPNSKGGVKKLNVPLYKTYAPQLEKYEQVYFVQQNGLDLLGTNCLYCGKVFVPKKTHVVHRIGSICGTQRGELRFYCSQACKDACPTFNQKKYPEGYAPATSREMQPQFRKMVLERDNWVCTKCGANKDTDINVELHAHHIHPVVDNPIESCDVNDGRTVCKPCHIKIHRQPGCTLQELRCTKEESNMMAAGEK